ncbi:MAG: hypothetical protein ATN36_01090 [Epulopiscium sp. Nele67-Bin005]|nr:MAG: hypothetical protein ATN36_01090 [Epulopiscium sp. Nele67-Bin005]
MGYNTINRKIVLDFLQDNSDRFISIGDICNEFERCGRSINISTVYRLMDKLIKEGVITRHIEDKKSYFRFVSEQCSSHLHMKCSVCGIVRHLPKDLLEALSDFYGFKVEYERSIIQGVCTVCK